MKDEGLDFLPMILLLGVVVAICMNLIMPLYRDTRELVYSEVYDKSLVQVKGEQHKSGTLDDQGYTYTEMLLRLSNQTYFMPNPRVLHLGTEIFEVQSDAVSMIKPNEGYTDSATTEYVPDNRVTSIMMKKALHTWCTAFTAKHHQNGFKLKFALRFSTGAKEGTGDDCYRLCVIASNTEGKLRYLECGAAGDIEELTEAEKAQNYSLDYYL